MTVSRPPRRAPIGMSVGNVEWSASGDRLVAAQTVPVADDGQPVAVVGPSPEDSLADLAASGQFRVAVDSRRA